MRRFGWIVAGLLTASGALAQTELVSRSEAQRLDCLVKPAAPLSYPEREARDGSSGAMRLRIRFSRPDAPPDVDILANTASEGMQDRVLAHVAGYRLPCLRADDGVVLAVQDFNFVNTDKTLPLLPLAPADTGKAPECLVRPREDPESVVIPPNAPVMNLVAQITFKGDGQQAPEVEFTYASRKASKGYKLAMARWASGYRMPCRTAQDPPTMVEEHFKLVPTGMPVARFSRERFALMEFLGLTHEPARQKAYFDLNTMNCPFKVAFTVRGGDLPHQARVTGPADPNKVAFLDWLAHLQIDFASNAIANELFGSELQIDVPCGVIDLRG